MTPNRKNRLAAWRRAALIKFEQAINKTLVKGFHGKITLEFDVQDGVPQQDLIEKIQIRHRLDSQGTFEQTDKDNS